MLAATKATHISCLPQDVPSRGGTCVVSPKVQRNIVELPLGKGKMGRGSREQERRVRYGSSVRRDSKGGYRKRVNESCQSQRQENLT